MTERLVAVGANLVLPGTGIGPLAVSRFVVHLHVFRSTGGRRHRYGLRTRSNCEFRKVRRFTIRAAQKLRRSNSPSAEYPRAAVTRRKQFVIDYGPRNGSFSYGAILCGATFVWMRQAAVGPGPKIRSRNRTNVIGGPADSFDHCSMIGSLSGVDRPWPPWQRHACR